MLTTYGRYIRRGIIHLYCLDFLASGAELELLLCDVVMAVVAAAAPSVVVASLLRTYSRVHTMGQVPVDGWSVSGYITRQQNDDWETVHIIPSYAMRQML